jgi:hypothetical protein
MASVGVLALFNALEIEDNKMRLLAKVADD